MNYHPLFGMNILVSNEFAAAAQLVLFYVFVVFIILVVVAYQTRRAMNKRSGRC